MIEFELDIPSLTSEEIQIEGDVFSNVEELHSSSMIDRLLMNEMLILLINSFDRGVRSYQRKMNMIQSNDLKMAMEMI